MRRPCAELRPNSACFPITKLLIDALSSWVASMQTCSNTHTGQDPYQSWERVLTAPWALLRLPSTQIPQSRKQTVMGKIIGIDLGTTNSVVAIMEGKEPKVIANEEGARLTPSVVAFDEKGEVLVGQIARRQAITNPENTVFSSKRFMGRKFNDPVTQEESKRVPFKLVAGAQRRRRVRDPRQAVLAAGDRRARADEAQARRRGVSGRDGDRGGHHGPGVLQRLASARRPRTPARSPASRSSASSTSRPRPRSPTVSTRPRSS